MLVVGLTGGIGSGKSTVSRIFADLGITIVDTDVIARSVVEANSPCLEKIQAHFGPSVIYHDGSLDRASLRKLVFDSPQEKTWLENLLHPEIGKITRAQIAASTTPYTILSSPLLLESADADIVDITVVVDAPKSCQLERARARDASSAEQIEKIIASQLSREDKLAKADEIIDNSGSIEATKHQVQSLHTKLLKQSQKV